MCCLSTNFGNMIIFYLFIYWPLCIFGGLCAWAANSRKQLCKPLKRNLLLRTDWLLSWSIIMLINLDSDFFCYVALNECNLWSKFFTDSVFRIGSGELQSESDPISPSALSDLLWWWLSDGEFLKYTCHKWLLLMTDIRTVISRQVLV